MLFIDIETVPNMDMVKFLPEVKPPGTIKKPESIQAWMEENGDEATRLEIAKMSLDPLLFQLRAVALAPDVDAEAEVWLCHNQAEEKALLEQLWKKCFPVPWIGYNILAFDLPRLLTRSMMLGVQPSRIFSMRRYTTDEIIDLMMLLKGWDSRVTSAAGMGLKPICKVLGIPNDMPDTDGSQVSSMTDDELVKYGKSDIALTQMLFQRMAGVYFRAPHVAARQKPYVPPPCPF